MNLLDQGVKMAAEADEPLEMNFVRKHDLQQAEVMGINLRQARFLQRFWFLLVKYQLGGRKQHLG